MLSNQTIDIPCSNCGRNTSKTIGWLKSNKRYTCGCGTIVELNATDLNRKIKEVERALGKLFK